ncbi:MAG: amidohydrolase family protein, partial [Planctomycetaceae bacterium]|nr:amidohydrolase family protein [Planctomycetaceae bacterium]
MNVLHESGIPAAEVIKIATINGAQALGIAEDHGSIERGKSGDLCIVRGNPLQQIRNTRNVTHVVRAGLHYDPQQLLNDCRGKLGPTNADEAKAW